MPEESIFLGQEDRMQLKTSRSRLTEEQRQSSAEAPVAQPSVVVLSSKALTHFF